MIHFFYAGHFEKAQSVMKLEKPTPAGVPRPVVARPLVMAMVAELLDEKGISVANIPDDWRLGLEKEGFIVCDAYTRSREALDFLGQLAARTGCDLCYDGILAVAPDELTVQTSAPIAAARRHA